MMMTMTMMMIRPSSSQSYNRIVSKYIPLYQMHTAQVYTHGSCMKNDEARIVWRHGNLSHFVTAAIMFSYFLLSSYSFSLQYEWHCYFLFFIRSIISHRPFGFLQSHKRGKQVFKIFSREEMMGRTLDEIVYKMI